jgi:hypothetical protein
VLEIHGFPDPLAEPVSYDETDNSNKEFLEKAFTCEKQRVEVRE